MHFALLPALKPYIPVFLHTLTVYLCLLVLLRIVGRRVLGQNHVISLVAIVLLGSAVETSMVAGNTTLTAGLVCAATLFALDYTFSRVLLRSRHFRHLIGAGPILLIHNGRILEDHLRRAGMTEADLYQAIREHEESDPARIAYAVLETDGEINVVRTSDRIEKVSTPTPA